MKKIIIIGGCLLVAAFSQAQSNNGNNSYSIKDNKNSGITVGLGAAVTYYYGPGDRNFGSFDNDRVNWQINGMIGFTLARDKSGRPTRLAAFGTYGLNNSFTMNTIISDQQYTTSASTQSSSNNYFQLEGGLIIANILRISTGVGQQNFNSQTLVSSSGIIVNESNIKYYSSTIGFQFNIGSASWVINCNIASGKDYNKTVITPYTGLMFQF